MVLHPLLQQTGGCAGRQLSLCKMDYYLACSFVAWRGRAKLFLLLSVSDHWPGSEKQSSLHGPEN